MPCLACQLVASRWCGRGALGMVPPVEQGTRVASMLRRAREERELSIEQAAADAGIPLRYARLLEGAPSGSSVGISDELYLVPFFRRYALFLGMNPEHAIADLLGEVETLGPPSAPSQL